MSDHASSRDEKAKAPAHASWAESVPLIGRTKPQANAVAAAGTLQIQREVGSGGRLKYLLEGLRDVIKVDPERSWASYEVIRYLESKSVAAIEPEVRALPVSLLLELSLAMEVPQYYTYARDCMGLVYLAATREQRSEMGLAWLAAARFDGLRDMADVERLSLALKEMPAVSRAVVRVGLSGIRQLQLGAIGISPTERLAEPEERALKQLSSTEAVYLAYAVVQAFQDGIEPARRRWGSLPPATRRLLLDQSTLGPDPVTGANHLLELLLVATPHERQPYGGLLARLDVAHFKRLPKSPEVWGALTTARAELGPADRRSFDVIVRWANPDMATAIGAYVRTPEEERRVDGQAAQVLAFIQKQARARAAAPRSIDPGSMFYQRLEQHYLREALARPSPQTGNAAAEKIGAQMPEMKGSSDYWERGAPSWNQQEVPGALRVIRPRLPAKAGAGTDILRVENRKALPYLDVPGLLGKPNTDTRPDADVTGGGSNMSQLMHWATGVKHSQVDPSSMRDLFLAYEYFHLEGWDVFGEDPINDLISEDAGRLLGRELRAGRVTKENLRAKLDAGFAEARAWVGSLLAVRQGELDKWILAENQRPANMWWGALAPADVWGEDTVRSMLRSGYTLGEVMDSNLVTQIIEIYALIFESELWQRQHGAIKNSNLILNMLGGKFDSLFEKSVKKGDVKLREHAEALWNSL